SDLISSVAPTATKRPALTAKASARGVSGSTVWTLALNTTRSGSWSAAATMPSGHDAPARPVRPAPDRPLNSLPLKRCVAIALYLCDLSVPVELEENSIAERYRGIRGATSLWPMRRRTLGHAKRALTSVLLCARDPIHFVEGAGPPVARQHCFGK